ncbi:hypothetical protein MRB53_042000 [Persea americana]|nr:hypothetical protein MRB53_042000 [Persea americana]
MARLNARISSVTADNLPKRLAVFRDHVRSGESRSRDSTPAQRQIEEYGYGIAAAFYFNALHRYFDPNQDPDTRRAAVRKSRALERDFIEHRDALLRGDGDHSLSDTINRANENFNPSNKRVTQSSIRGSLSTSPTSRTKRLRSSSWAMRAPALTSISSSPM